MLATVPSAWLKIENTAPILSKMKRSLQFIWLLLLGVLVMRLFLAGDADRWVTFLYFVAFGITLAVASVVGTLQMFCEGTIVRLRQLGTLV